MAASSPRPPWVHALVVAVCACVNYGVFRAHGAVTSIKALRAQATTLAAERDQLPPFGDTAALEAEVAEIESARAGLDAQAAALAARVAPEAERPSLDLRITRLAERAGLLVETQTPRGGATRSWTLRGSFGRIRAFLATLAALDRRVVVTELALAADADGQLAISLTVAP